MADVDQQGTKITQCPWENAFWDGEQMAFGEGLDTLDVTTTAGPNRRGHVDALGLDKTAPRAWLCR
ncbi:hypothetical protein [Actinocrispum sp. NPDC049592]|uniref:hypothetical protein n=1 Tax=Actinocrispum sp. NPDC049592 TaxID=3154835 RepID=UPI0034402088